MYCCVGIYCPNCTLVVSVSAVNQTFFVNSNMAMACAEKVFRFRIRGSAKPGKYPVQVRNIARSKIYYIFLFLNLPFEKKGIKEIVYFHFDLSHLSRSETRESSSYYNPLLYTTDRNQTKTELCHDSVNV